MVVQISHVDVVDHSLNKLDNHMSNLHLVGRRIQNINRDMNSNNTTNFWLPFECIP